MAQDLDTDGIQVADAAGAATPVQPTLRAADARLRFWGSAEARQGTKTLTIALCGATSYHLSIPNRAKPESRVAWDVTLVIQPGISEATVTSEDFTGNRTTVRRVLIARTAAREHAAGESTRILH
jgi:hypothetical protein